jgi:hypothetical protein
MDEHFRPLEMAEEPVPEPVSFVRPCDEARHVGHDERAFAMEADHTEVRDERRERIVRDFRAGCGDPRDHRRLAGIRKADESDIGQQLEMETQVFFFSRQSGLRPPRCAVRGGRERRVAVPAEAPLRDEHAFAICREIRNLQILALRGSLVHDRAGRDEEIDVDSGLACPIGAFAVAATSCGEDFLEAVIEERVQVRVGNEVNRAARPSVAAARPAARHELLAPEGHRATAAVACGDVNIDFIYKHISARTKRRSLSSASAARACSSALRTSSAFQRQHADHTTARAMIFELHAAVDLREERVVLPETDVQTGTEPAAALTDEDRSSRHDVAVVALHAQALRVAVPTVTRAALTLFCCHDASAK